MHTVDVTVCYGKNKKKAFQNGLKVFYGILKFRWEELLALDYFFPFDGEEEKMIPEMGKYKNRFYHERWEPVIEGNSKKAKEIFDYLTSARFGHRMIFSKLWFTYNKTKQGDIYECQDKSLT